MLDYKKFWKLRDAYEPDAMTAAPVDRFGRDGAVQLICGTYASKLPVAYKYQSGLHALDLMSTGWHNRFLVTTRVVDALSENRFTGWSTYPVQLLDSENIEVAGYVGLSITGQGGKVDKTKREAVGESRTGRYQKTQGVYFDEKNWDRTDIFLVGNTAHICVVEAVYNAIMALHPRNIRFDRLDEVRGIELKKRIRFLQ